MNLKPNMALAGVLALGLGAGNALAGNTLLTFQVDMSPQVTAGTFVPGVNQLEAHGTFNGWGALTLTNDPSATNPNLFTGSAVDTADANGTKVEYKFVIDGGTWENPATGNNRAAHLPAGSEGILVLPVAFFNDAGTPVTSSVTFQVDMAQQINTGAFRPGTDTVSARGMFNGWSTSALTNDPSIKTTNQFGLVTSNVYVGTFDVTASPGAAQKWKFFFNNGADVWEMPSAVNSVSGDGDHNRFFANVPQTLPIVYFNDAPYAPVANNLITFQVDMTPQVLNGTFIPTSGTVEVRGEFNGWGTPQTLCTNDPAASNPNLYTAVVSITDGVGATKSYKFWSSVSVNGGWEQLGDNRSLRIVSGTSQVLAPVYFSDLDPNDLLPVDTVVTFSVNMTNAVGTDTHVFDPSVDNIYMNGNFINWNTANGGWNTTMPQLTNNPVGSQLYSLEILVPKGTPVQLVYKYSINAVDNEAPANSNHTRYVRQTPTYVLPQDKFANQLTEQSFGNLTSTVSTPGHVLLSWLGRPGVHLQSSANLSNPVWLDHPGTDGLSSTNWPSTDSAQFFRLVRP